MEDGKFIILILSITAYYFIIMWKLEKIEKKITSN